MTPEQKVVVITGASRGIGADGSLSGHWRARRRTDSPDLPNLIHCIADVQA
jgi:hypothetical protein